MDNMSSMSSDTHSRATKYYIEHPTTKERYPAKATIIEAAKLGGIEITGRFNGDIYAYRHIQSKTGIQFYNSQTNSYLSKGTTTKNNTNADHRKQSIPEEAIITGLYLAKYNRTAYNHLGLGANMTQTHDAIGKILGVKLNTIKNIRDDFDQHYPHRKGWQTNSPPRREEIRLEYEKYTEPELLHIVQSFLNRSNYDINIQNLSQREITDVLLKEAKNNHEQELTEGQLKKRVVKVYERNTKARAECIKHYGNKYTCEICDINFEQMYGEIGREFIHVHHKVPISETTEEYIINPKEDLIPVCPNCHAMIHRDRKNTLSQEDLKDKLRAHSRNNHR